MTIWRDIYVGQAVDAPTLALALAAAFGVDTARVAIKEGDGMWPDWVEGREVWAEVLPVRGEARLMAALFVFRPPDEVEQLDDRAVTQALADALGCAVLLPDEADPHSDNYWLLRPGQPVERVALDSDGLDEDPPRVAVTGPATRNVLEIEHEAAAAAA